MKPSSLYFLYLNILAQISLFQTNYYGYSAYTILNQALITQFAKNVKLLNQNFKTIYIWRREVIPKLFVISPFWWKIFIYPYYWENMFLFRFWSNSCFIFHFDILCFFYSRIWNQIKKFFTLNIFMTNRQLLNIKSKNNNFLKSSKLIQKDFLFDIYLLH